jgi:hypothetical protein
MKLPDTSRTAGATVTAAPAPTSPVILDVVQVTAALDKTAKLSAVPRSTFAGLVATCAEDVASSTMPSSSRCPAPRPNLGPRGIARDDVAHWAGGRAVCDVLCADRDGSTVAAASTTGPRGIAPANTVCDVLCAGGGYRLAWATLSYSEARKLAIARASPYCEIGEIQALLLKQEWLKYVFVSIFRKYFSYLRRSVHFH